jgi:hypothetical protein
VVPESYVAPKDKEIRHECTYVGPHDRPQEYSDDKPISPSPGRARDIALSILSGKTGRYHSSVHFRNRMEERDFDVFEIEYVIRNGRCLKGGEFCEKFRNHQYTFRGDVDGIGFDAVFALSADHDLIKFPLLILISGCFKTKSGRRGRTY